MSYAGWRLRWTPRLTPPNSTYHLQRGFVEETTLDDSAQVLPPCSPIVSEPSGSWGRLRRGFANSAIQLSATTPNARRSDDQPDQRSRRADDRPPLTSPQPD